MISKKIYFATPTYDGSVSSNYDQSMIAVAVVLTKLGIEFDRLMTQGDCFLDRARNYAACKFLKTDFTHLFFIDSDVGFRADAVVRLLNRDKDVIAGLPPFKSEIAREYPATLMTDDAGRPVIEDGLIRALRVATGFLCIKRHVIETMESYYPELSYSGLGTYCRDEDNIPGIFNTAVDDNLKVSEDYMFCQRWVEMGGQIHIEPDIDFTHVGRKVYRGNYHEYLLSCPGGSKDPLKVIR